jgi:hypothetical protein
MAVAIRPGSEKIESEKKEAGVVKGEAELIELDGRRKFFQLRTLWSRWIIGWISVLIGFNAFLTVLVGASILDFYKYQWFVTAVTVETFLQIVGMGYVAVRFLFSHQK